MRRLAWRAPVRRRRDEQGYVAVFTVLIFVVIFGMAAFAVDVGQWYLTGQQAQRAADAAALGGVPRLPGDQAGAFAAAQRFAAANGFKNGSESATVVPGIDGQPTRLRVTVSKTVDSTFGSLLGVDSTTITRSAVADYAGPVPMGSPCNTFGNDPDASSTVTGSVCGGVNGQYWANVNSYAADKANGDPYQSNVCSSSTSDECAGGANSNYSAAGYFYTVSLKRDVSNLRIEIFDPAAVNVGLQCGTASGDPTYIDGASSITAANAYVSDPATRYAAGSSSKYCTGDNRFAGTGAMSTEFTVRDPSLTPWDPTSFPPRPGCQRTFAGFNGSLSNALAKNKGNNVYVAEVFRRWVSVCTIPVAKAGDYLVQVRAPTSSVNAGNRFAIRATSSTDTTAKEAISISGREKMSLYTNAPSATTEFYLARVPNGAAGQILNIKLFDVGDSSTSGVVRLVAPPESGVTLRDCVGTGPITGSRPDCSFTVNTSTHNGKWQIISIPIPTGYTCDDRNPAQCWVRLKYEYGSGAVPHDVTAWTANIEGDPVRLVE